MSTNQKPAEPVMGEAATREALSVLSLDSADGVTLERRLGELLRPYGAAPAEEFWPEILRSGLRQERLLMEIRDALVEQNAPKRRTSKGE